MKKFPPTGYIYSRFKRWLKQFVKDNNAIGDLSRDVYDDSAFPYYNDKEKLLNYLKNRGACSDTINTFNGAFKKYKINP